MIGDIEKQLNILIDIDFYRISAKKKFQMYHKVLKDVWRKKHFDVIALKKNRRFVLTRTYLNKSRLWYFGKKQFLLPINLNKNNLNVKIQHSKIKLLDSLISGFTKNF